LSKFWFFASKNPARRTVAYLPGFEALEERSLPSVSPVHLYNFNGTLADEMGGPALIADGGTLVGGRYVFNANQGLRLKGALADTSNYSIELVAQFSSLAKFWIKIIDFQERTSDVGLYVGGAHLRLYPGVGGPDSITANQDFQVALTRNGASGETDIYLNGVLQQIYFGAVSFPSTNVLTFFEDDLVSISEATAGSVDSIAIYDRPLTAAEVSHLSNSPVVPPMITVTARGGVYNGLAYAVTTASVTGAGNTVLASLGDPTLSYTYYIGASVSGTGFAAAPKNAGTYTVVAHWTSNNPNYASGDSAPTIFTIAPAPLTISANNQTKITGEPNPTFTVSYSGFVLGQGPSVLSGTLMFSTSATASSPPGIYTMTPSGLTSTNYAIRFVPGTLTVMSCAQATNNLIAHVDAGKLPCGSQQSLDSKLRAAINSFNRGNTTSALHQLGAFVNQVTALKGKKIDGTLADVFIGYAQQIILAANEGRKKMTLS
jgi:hypothetical protein